MDTRDVTGNFTDEQTRRLADWLYRATQQCLTATRHGARHARTISTAVDSGATSTKLSELIGTEMVTADWAASSPDGPTANEANTIAETIRLCGTALSAGDQLGLGFAAPVVTHHIVKAMRRVEPIAKTTWYGIAVAAAINADDRDLWASLAPTWAGIADELTGACAQLRQGP